MKKVLLLTLALFGYLSSYSQYYQFQVDSAVFTPLQSTDLSDTVLTANTVFTVDASYRVFGNGPSTLYEAGINGFLVSTGPSYSYAYDPMLASMQKANSQSALNVAEIWDGSDSILVVEWIHMGLAGHPSTDFVNLQLRLYRFQEKIEYYYGPSQVTDSAAFSGSGPIVNLSWLSQDFTVGYDVSWLSGDPDNPNYVQSLSPLTLDGVPSENTRFTFYKASGIGLEEGATDGFTFRVFPNPASDVITINSIPQEATQLQVIDLQGKVLISDSISGAEQQTIDVSSLSPGSYMVQISDGKRLMSKPLVIK